MTTPDSTAGHPSAAGPAVADRRVAVVGMAGRFPGADSVAAYWDNLCRGVDSVRRLRPAQLAAAGLPPAVYEHPDYVPVTGLLGAGDPTKAVAEFAADLFGISAREAALTDPQQRLFLEICHQALEEAGYAGSADRRVGVFAGCGMNLYSYHTYLRHHLTTELADPVAAMQAAIGNQPDFLATRVAYRLNLTGPAVSVQTACSTGLVAVHQAVRSLLAGECEVAVAGAAAVHIPQYVGYHYVDGTILSRTGTCRPFDAAADGTVGGNGVAVVVLKPLARALADRDTVLAVIHGSAVSNDGATKVGFTAPSVAGQVAAVTAALDAAGVGSGAIGYVEAHGTGTRLGDPVEVRALTEAFAARAGGPVLPGSCALGSVKANIGHLDSCAGVAGLVKAVYAVRTGKLPPQIHFDRLNPEINLSGGPFFIPVEETGWPAGYPARLAGVQALGVGGTNAHLVVGEPPARPVPAPAAEPAAESSQADPARPVLVLSAATATALDTLAAEVAARLREPDPPDPADLLATTALGRPHRRHRLVALGTDLSALADVLTAEPASRDGAVVRGDSGPGPGPLVFVFSGQGGPDGSAAATLYHRYPAFREVVDACAGWYRDRWGGDDLAAVVRGDGAAGAPGTDLVQPALFACQVALAATWASFGVRPDLVVGHSAGEYAAWCVAGGLPLRDGLDLVTQRGRLMQELTPPGAMLAVRADRRAVAAIQAVVGGLDLAVVNGERDHVLAGEPEAAAEAGRLLRRRGLVVAELPVTRAFHSALLEPMLPALGEAVAAVRFTPTAVPLISALDGERRPPGTVPEPEYLCAHTREPVRWDLALATLGRAGCRLFLELGPEPVLAGYGRRSLPGSRWLPARPATDLPRTLAALHCAGAVVDWRPFAAGGGRIPLPAHPLERRTYWIGPGTGDAPGPQAEGAERTLP